MKQVKWVFSLLGKTRVKLYISYALALVFNALLIFDSEMVRIIVNKIPSYVDPSYPLEKVKESLIPLVALAFTVIVIRCVIRFLSNHFRDEAGQKVNYVLRNSLYNKLASQSRRFLMANRTGDLINQCTGDVEVIGNFVGWISWAIFDSIIMVVAVLIAFFAISWKFTLVLLVLTPFALMVAIKLGKTVHPIFVKARQQLSRLNTVVTENINGNRVVRAFCREPYEIEKFDKENNKYYELNLESNKAWVTYSPYMEMIANIMSGCSIIAGSLLVIHGDITVGDLMVFTSLSWMLNEPFFNLGFLINETQRFMASADRVHELYDSQPEIVSPENGIDSGTIRGQVDFDHVSLSFDGTKVLKDIDIHIPAGATVGIMGPTGSGKSSLFNLLDRFVEPDQGTVRVDGVDVKKYNLQFLRRHVGIALQDVFLFSDTVESNIAYSDPDMPMDLVYESAIDADADSFVRALPDGYDTIVGERGMGLSGGQKQRLSLARALATEAPIIVLDDTTSAVDLETEHYIQGRLSQRKQKATTFIVAQRISSVKNADIILILEDGCIREKGTHEELLKQKGYYYHIYQIQQGYATEADKAAAREAAAAAWEGGAD